MALLDQYLANTDLSRAYNAELVALAERSNGTREDAICEWAYRPELYPTLCAYVRHGVTSTGAVTATAAELAYQARVDKLRSRG